MNESERLALAEIEINKLRDKLKNQTYASLSNDIASAFQRIDEINSRLYKLEHPGNPVLEKTPDDIWVNFYSDGEAGKAHSSKAAADCVSKGDSRIACVHYHRVP